MTDFNVGFAADGHVVSVRFKIGGRQDIAAELERLNLKRALVLTTPDQRPIGEEAVATLGALAVGHYDNATMHTPVHITDEAMALVEKTKADCVVSIGGGSTIGLGKAIALRTDLPQITLPTTYAGSEATPIIGQTENGEKVTGSTQKVQPEVVIYDAELIAGLPVNMTVTSGLNAMAHAVETLYASNANRLSSALAMDGLRAFVTGLPKVVETPSDLAAREDTLFGAWACGTLLGQVGMALHHKLCHVLGGTLNLPHAPTHAIILPHATGYNEPGARAALAELADLLGAATAAGGLWDFSKKLGAPLALKELGVKEADLDHVAKLAASKPYPNPTPINEAGIRKILQSAYDGKRPSEG